MSEFSHFDDNARAVMVDISPKASTHRTARACSYVRMNEETISAIENRLLPKGDCFEVARIAGIMAAKKTSDLIPMCHPLKIDYIDISIDINREEHRVEILAEVKVDGKTGVEMEALTAVSVAALTVYDMCKAVDKEMIIEGCCLLEKRGGKSDFSKP